MTCIKLDNKYTNLLKETIQEGLEKGIFEPWWLKPPKCWCTGFRFSDNKLTVQRELWGIPYLGTSQPITAAHDPPREPHQPITDNQVFTFLSQRGQL